MKKSLSGKFKIITVMLATAIIFGISACGTNAQKTNISETEKIIEASSADTVEEVKAEESAPKAVIAGDTKAEEPAAKELVTTETKAEEQAEEAIMAESEEEKSEEPEVSEPVAEHIHNFNIPVKGPVESTIQENVWVVDQAARTEEVPIYEERYADICNQCGQDITNGNGYDYDGDGTIGPWDHLAQAELEGTGNCGSFTSKYVSVEVGSRTVTYDEVGHYEMQVYTETLEGIVGYMCECGEMSA